MLICLAAFTGRAIINAGAWPLFAVAAVLTLGLYDTLNREIPETDFIKIQASVFVTCGVLLIATLAHPESPLVVRIRLALGFFLLVQGFFLYFFAFGIVRFRAAAITHSYWIPAFAALAAFSWLAIYFAGMHSELVRQADAGNELLETRWVSLQLQEVYRIAVNLFR